MIPASDVASWQQASPLDLDDDQAARELVLRRLLIEVGNDSFMSDRIVCSGGTTLQHALLPYQRRHSEDLDLLAAEPLGPLRPFCDRWHDHIAPRLEASVKINTRKQITKVRLTVPGSHSDTAVKVELAHSPQHIAAAATAGRRRLSMSTGWFSGTSQVLCVAPETLAASKVAAALGRNKPRDLADLHDMRTLLGLSDDAVAERFYDLFRIPQWTAGKARRLVAGFHASRKFLDTLEAERSGGFIPEDFDLAAAQQTYLDVVAAAARIDATRKRARKLAAAEQRRGSGKQPDGAAAGTCQHPCPTKAGEACGKPIGSKGNCGTPGHKRPPGA